MSDLVTRWHVGRIHPTPDVEPDGWTLEKLCDNARLESGHTPSRNRPDYWDGGIPWLSLHSSKTIEGKTLYNTKMTVSALGLANSSARLLPEGTVALSRTATIGKVAILGREMATSQDFACYICGTRLLNSYLAHLFRGVEAEWERLMAGSTHNTIFMPAFENMQILLPPMKEQEAIAEALSDADALIEGLERLIAKKRLLKQGAMQDLLTAKRRLPEFSGEWVKRKLGDYGKCLRGVSYDGQADLSETDTSGTVRLLRANNVQEGQIVFSNMQFVNSARVGQHQLLQDGDILICMANGSRALVGKSAKFSRPDEMEYTFGAFMGAFRMTSDACSGRYITHLLQSDRYRRILGVILSGSAINNLAPSQIENFKFSFPVNKLEQEAIADVLDDLGAEIQALEVRLEKARQVKEGMMQNLLTGRIRLV
ncbi:restriction endonuclease subunit S [Jannaschia sp. 2305UL9-9]|uniref:restriction endonuclease subunit S n=1 Tax=Jannaschia sp. 2305UL9-9 TaxID=3121638 RepID=UPI0035281BD4